MMKKRCFLAGRKDSLFKNLMANLLSDLIDDLDLQESHADDMEGLLNEISETEPAFILLDDSSPFSGESPLVRILIHRPNLPVIVISEDSNLMHIVHRETRIINSSNDLVKAVNLI
jgi:DNA-binding NtrC family response regulator